MPLARTLLGSASYGSGAGSKTVSGLTVTAGDLLVAIGCGFRYGAACNVTIADTNMGGISWTEITYAGETDRPTTSIFWGVVVSGSVTGTVTVGGDADAAMWLEVHKFTGYDTGTPVTGGTANGVWGSSIDCALGASPVSGDIAINASFLTAYDAVHRTATPGDSFVEISDSYVDEWGTYYSYQSQDRTGSTSSACSKTITADSTVGWASAIVKAAQQTVAPKMDSYRHRRSG